MPPVKTASNTSGLRPVQQEASLSGATTTRKPAVSEASVAANALNLMAASRVEDREHHEGRYIKKAGLLENGRERQECTCRGPAPSDGARRRGAARTQ